MSLTLKNCKLTMPKGIIRGNLVISNGLIKAVGSSVKPQGEIINIDDLYVLPGFREQHMHDMMGATRYIDKPSRLKEISIKLAEQGITAFKLATVAMPIDDLLAYLNTCREFAESDGTSLGARFEGVFVEGTFINRECAGAQPPEYIIHPDEPKAKTVLDKIIETRIVRLINIVPDFGVDLIKYASSRGLIVGCGHCKASANRLAEAVEAGLRFIVHITNGAMGQSFKPFEGGGTYEGALELPVYVEIITDGFHVNFKYVSDIIERRIQRGRMHEIVVVTDRLFPSPDEAPRGEIRMFSVLCRKPADEDVLYAEGFFDDSGRFVKSPPYTLCGSLLTMPRAFENLLNLFTVDHSGFMIDVPARGIHEAIWLASNFMSTNQARLEGRNDVGVIDIGRRADLTVVRIEGEPGRYRVGVEATIVEGKLVYSKL